MVAHRTDTKLQEDMANLKWFSVAEQSWSYMVWDAENKLLIPDGSRRGLGVDKAVVHVQNILKHAAEPDTIARFHPTRPLVPELKGDAITMLLQTGLQTQASLALHDDLRALSGSAVGLLVGLQMKPDRGQRSALAQAMAKDLPP